MPEIVLTLDLGTSATKAALWSGSRLAALGRASVRTDHPEPGRAEQDPDDWWRSVVAACGEAAAQAPDEFGRIECIGFAAARETFALFDADLHPIGPGILWSDQRAQRQADELAQRWGGAERARARTGVVLNGAACAAKVAWVAEHRAEDFSASRWVLAPRDLVVARLTGEVVTDATLASRTGGFGLDGAWLPGATELLGERLPAARPSTTVVGTVRPDAATELGLGPGISVVVGAGDRACEVLGVGADLTHPMLSWGTTANVSVPLHVSAEELPTVAAVSFGALGGFVLEAGLSSAGAALATLAGLTGHDHDELLILAAAVEPGADGLVALPWFHGARAPWWRPDASAGFVGLRRSHGPAHLARALLEAVAFDVARCVELVAPEATTLALAGRGAGDELWRTIVAAACDLPTQRRVIDDAASVGARIVAGAACGEPVDLDELSPVLVEDEPDPELVAAYGEVRARSDAAATALLGAVPDRPSGEA